MKGISPDRRQREWDTEEARAKYTREKCVKDIRYYARNCGFDVVEQEVETKDGYLLKVFKVVCLKQKMKIHSDGRGGFPVLIQHGLFQSCGSLYVLSRLESLGRLADDFYWVKTVSQVKNDLSHSGSQSMGESPSSFSLCLSLHD